MGSRSKQGARAVGLPAGCFVTCELCKVEQHGELGTLVEFVQAHRRDYPEHELKVWIPVDRVN
jgi:hypothetical protein